MRSISIVVRAGFVFALLVLGGSALAAPYLNSSDDQARVLAQGAEREAMTLGAQKSLGASASARVAERIARAERLLGDAELGRIRLSPVAQRGLMRALEALRSLPAGGPPRRKAVTALGTITGTITDTGVGVNGVQLQAWDFSQQIRPTGAGIVSTTSTNVSGAFTFTVPPGKYHIRTTSSGTNKDYVNQAYGFGTCADNFYCPRYVGTIVTVTSGGTTSAIDFSLAKGGQIQGHVQRASDSSALAATTVRAVSESGIGFAQGATDGSGNYTIRGLAPGRWRVFVDTEGSGLLDQLYNGSGNVDCANDCDFVQPVGWITVSGPNIVTGIDFSLAAAATLSGTITDSSTSGPLQNATVALISDDRYTNRTADAAIGAPNGESTDAAGNYVISQVRPGTYRVLVSRAGTDVDFNVTPTHIPRVYPGTDCVGSCDPLVVGGTITVAAGATVAGINVALSPGATVSGTVLRATDSTPVVGASVNVINGSGAGGSLAITDASGNFTAQGVPDGVSYVVADARSQQLIQTWLGDVPCQTFDCINIGTPINAQAGTPVTGLTIRAPQAGSIQGTITDTFVGVPAPTGRTRIELFEASTGRLIDQSIQFFDPGLGTTYYKVQGVPPGAYHAIAASTSVVGWIDSAYGTGLPCPRGGCDLSVLPTIYVTAGLTTSPIDMSLQRGPVVRGRITDAATGNGVIRPAYDPSFSQVLGIYNTLNNYAGFGQVDAAGDYLTRTGFASGAYFLSTFLLRNNLPFGGGYIDQIYSGYPCPYGSCGYTTGTALSISGSDLNGINLALNKGGAITGTVTKLVGGGPLPGAVTVKAYNGAGRIVAVALSDVNGAYRLQGLPGGSYYVLTENTLGYLDKLYNNLACEPFCNPVTGTPITVTAPATTAGINFALDQSATVQGTVMMGAASVPNVPVEIYGAIGNLLRTTTTNAGGTYSFHDLAGGRYFVRSRNTTGAADALYNGFPCVGDACQVRRGTPIDVSAGGTQSGITLTLTSPGTIAGQITDSTTSNAISGIDVHLYDARGAFVANTQTNTTGNYQFNALAAGNYYAVTRGTPGYIDEAFNDTPCPAACDGLNGTPIGVSAGLTSTISFALSQGVSISGTVRSAPAAPIVGAVVQVYNAGGVPVGQIATNPSGNYQVDTLPSGLFYVRTQNGLGYIDEVFDNRPCSGYCDVIHGDPLNTSSGPVGLVDFQLAAGGSISGSVTSSAGATGIALATVQAFDVNGIPAGSARTDASGNYIVSGLKNGNYRLRTVNTSNFVNEIYNGLSCSPTPCMLSAASTIAVSGAVSGINFQLAPGGTISGTATDQFNNPLPTGTATLFDSNGVDIVSVPVTDGVWEFNGLANGTYFVLIENGVGLIDQLYNAVPCPAGACNIASVGTPIVLTGAAAAVSIKARSSTAAVDLKLNTGQTISGNVKDASTNAPIDDATVYFFNSSGQLVGDGTTDGLGDFTSSGGFAPGTYYAATANGSARGVGNNYINSLYNGSNCLLACNVTAGTAINISAGPVTGINFSLGTGVGFGGKVFDNGNNPLALVDIKVYNSSGTLAGQFSTDSLGRYNADGLPAGTYYARSANGLGLQDYLYGGNPCTGNCNVLGGTPISINLGNQPQNIDFVLTPQIAIFSNGFE